MEPKVFAIAPASGSSLGWMWGIIVLLALMLVGTVAFLGWSLYAARHATFSLSPESLRISADVYGRTIRTSALVVEGARRVDFGVSPEFLPKWRTNGIGLPGYQAGWFKLRNGEKALLFLADRQRAVYVPTREGYALLISPQDPDGFLAALRGHQSAP